MLRDSRFGRLEVESGKDVCAGGGDLALTGDSRVMVAASGPAEVLVILSSFAFVPDPSPGDDSR